MLFFVVALDAEVSLTAEQATLYMTKAREVQPVQIITKNRTY